jgi:hypothetical protein
MYPFFLTLHSLLRWVVLLAGIVAVVMALRGWLGQRPWRPLENRVSLIYMISMDVQVLLGFLLYFVLSPITTEAFAEFGAAMGDVELRFWLLEHLFWMVLALVLIHVGRILIRRAPADLERHKRAAIFFGPALLAILLAIPWMRPLLRLGM